MNVPPVPVMHAVDENIAVVRAFAVSVIGPHIAGNFGQPVTGVSSSVVNGPSFCAVGGVTGAAAMAPEAWAYTVSKVRMAFPPTFSEAVVDIADDADEMAQIGIGQYIAGRGGA